MDARVETQFDRQPADPPINPRLLKLYHAARKLAITRMKKERIERMLANWPTRKPESEQGELF